MVDLDQGGTYREWVKTYLGPSVGWVNAGLRNVLQITAAGTYALDPSTTLVEVNVVGAVVIVLPSCVDPSAGAQAQPGLFTKRPVTIVDVGGNGAAHPITIQPNNVNETIAGLTQIQITGNYGGITLTPNNSQKKWVQPS